MPRPAPHLSRRHRCAAFADLSSDKERSEKRAVGFPFAIASPFGCELLASDQNGIIAEVMSIENLVTEKFGPLQGVKIVSTGTLIAQPFAAELAAEMGAEVIQIERPGIGDVGLAQYRHPAREQRR